MIAEKFNAKLARHCRVISNSNLFFLAATCLLTFMYVVYFSTKGFPISEGWYTEYAWRINHGDLPYKDFSLLFPPLYAHIIALVTKLFGYNLIVLRYLGVIVCTLEALTLFKIFRFLFSKHISFLISIISLIYGHSGAIDIIFYDYVYFMNVFLFTSLYYFMESLKLDKTRFFFLSGIFAGLVVLMKQNVGIIFVFYNLVFFLFLGIFSNESKSLNRLFSWIFGCMIPLVLAFYYLYSYDLWDNFLLSCFKSAVAAKGGITKILFEWILSSKLPLLSGFIVAIFFVAITNTYMLKCNKTISYNYLYSIPFLALFSICFIGIFHFLFAKGHRISTFISLFNDNLIMSCSFFFSLIFFWVSFLRIISHKLRLATDVLKDNKTYLKPYLTGTAFVVGWACGMSGGLATNQIMIPMGFLLGSLYCHLGYFNTQLFHLFAISLISLLLVTMGISKKYDSLYNWWGLQVGNIWNQQYEVNDPHFRGIMVDQDTKDAFDKIYFVAKKFNISDDDYVFVGPHCPIFYTVLNSHSKHYSIVQWFDVSSDKDIDDTTNWLRVNNPKIIVYCDLPEFVLDAHEKRFGRYQTRRLQRYLQGFVEARNYTLYGYQYLANGYLLKIYALE